MRSRGTTGTDVHTRGVAEALATRVEKLLGAPPYLVAARFSRKYIDANRIEAEAIESPQAKPVYDAYHEQIRQFRTVAALLEKHGPDALIGPKSVFGAVEVFPPADAPIGNPQEDRRYNGGHTVFVYRSPAGIAVFYRSYLE